MDDAPASELTYLLHHWQAGDETRWNEIFQRFYSELRGIALRRMQREREANSWQPTVLLGEIWIKVAQGASIPKCTNRHEFFAWAATIMTNILCDRARKRRTLKAGAAHAFVPLDKESVVARAEPEDLRSALDDLARVNPLGATILKLSISGYTHAEVAAAVEVSMCKVASSLKASRIWVADQLRG